MIFIDHDSTDNHKLTLWSHPFQMDDVLDKLLHNFIHCVDKRNHLLLLIIQLLNLRSVGKQKMLDAVHLMIKISVLEISTLWALKCRLQSSDWSSASRWYLVLAISLHHSYLSRTLDADMWGKQKYNIPILRTMTTKSIPTSFTCKWQTSKTTKRKDFSPSLLEDWSNIFQGIIVIDLIRAATVTIKCIGLCETPRF